MSAFEYTAFQSPVETILANVTTNWLFYGAECISGLLLLLCFFFPAVSAYFIPVVNCFFLPLLLVLLFLLIPSSLPFFLFFFSFSFFFFSSSSPSSSSSSSTSTSPLSLPTLPSHLIPAAIPFLFLPPALPLPSLPPSALILFSILPSSP
ncbi:hypothetical protein SprV_0502015300 [Sparganum proliferum]